MKNNAIMFMIDSVIWESVGTNRCKVSPTPFMDSLKKEGLWTNNLYSHGPYTDAATHSLYTGRNVLDDFGYFFKLNTSPINHYKAFKDNGYETIGFYYPYYMMGKNVTQYIDKLYYKAGFEFGSEWGGIFQYYYNIRKKRSLNSDELLMVKKRMELLFEVWSNFYDMISCKSELVSNMSDILANADIDKGKAIIEAESVKFKEDPDAYIEDFLNHGLEHILNSVSDFSINDRVSREFHEHIYSSHKVFFDKIKRNNFKANVLSTMPSAARVIQALKRYRRNKDKNEFEFIKNYLGGLFFFNQVRKRWGSPKWQNMPSTRFQLNVVENEILPNRTKDKPFFLCLNIEEAHNNLCFFTYDINNELIVDEEISVLEQFVDELGTSFKGNLVYYLGLRYMDYCIEKFCNYLKKNGLWDSTSILFTADHGSSYTFYPVHNARVNNFHDECYHIPVLIRHPGFAPKEINTYQYSKDVIPTFMDILGLKLSPYFKGQSMIRDNETRKCVVHEYMGPGCPDIIQRPIWFSARDKKYLVAYKVKLFGEFSEGELCEVYDLAKDPKEYNNIVYSVNQTEISYLLDEIKNRFEELKVDTAAYFQKLMMSKDELPINF